jgi:hypothetical protein
LERWGYVSGGGADGRHERRHGKGGAPSSDTKKTEYIIIIDNKPRITSVYIGERGRGKTLTLTEPVSYRSTIQHECGYWVPGFAAIVVPNKIWWILGISFKHFGTSGPPSKALESWPSK